MNTYYFTYGHDEEYPYVGGWTEICVPDCLGEHDAREIFEIFHPNRAESGCINCAGVYSQESFEATRMAKEGNFGKTCHEHIILHRAIISMCSL